MSREERPKTDRHKNDIGRNKRSAATSLALRETENPSLDSHLHFPNSSSNSTEDALITSLLQFSSDGAQGRELYTGSPLAAFDSDMGLRTTCISSGNDSSQSFDGLQEPEQIPKLYINVYTKVVDLIDDLAKVYHFGVEMELMCSNEDLCRLLDTIKDKFKMSIQQAAASSSKESRPGLLKPRQRRH
ncbi:hypothetical protein G6O67_006640 [Ophiocordyceps sinensis]|uniref:Uncharacterized protein n=1 Tax=Ophiocordyceps sinensis TaxID=72228 RepID=A0A8H4LX72_9HYPO|nr:hypothetical protein G6O67_006640 [Ophiocordyceps sinensis]